MIAIETEPCKGTNCGCTDGKSHSEECLAEHEACCNPNGIYDEEELDFLDAT